MQSLNFFSSTRLGRRVVRVLTRGMLGTVTSVRTTRAVAALTFDDGPHPEYTPRLLDILAKHQARATFFMVGVMAHRYPEIVHAVLQGGHAIGNHSWDHPSFPCIDSRERKRQLRRCAGTLGAAAHATMRPPYGHQTLGSRIDAFASGYRVIGWNADVEDWLAQDSNVLAGRIIGEMRPGAIFVLHDALFDVRDERAADRTFALEGLDQALGCLNNTVQFVTVPELLRVGPAIRSHWIHTGDIQWLKGTTTPWATHYSAIA